MENADHFTEMNLSNIEEVRQITTGGIVRSAEGDDPDWWNVVHVSSGVIQGISTWVVSTRIHELHILGEGSGRYMSIGDCVTYVYSGGVLSCSELYPDSHVFIREGGQAYNIAMYDFSLFSVNGGYASGINTTGATNGVSISNYGFVENITAAASTLIDVDAYGSAYYNTLVRQVDMRVYDGGFAYSNTVMDGSEMVVSRFGSAYENLVYSNDIHSTSKIKAVGAGYLSATYIGMRGELHMRYEGIASDTTVSAGGKMIFSGGFANDVVVSQGGTIDMRESGHVKELNLMGTLLMPTLDDIGIIYSRGASPYIEIFINYWASDFHVSSGGLMRLGEWGALEDTIVSSGGVIHNSGNDGAYRTKILSGGIVRIYSGGFYDTIVYDGGILRVGSATVTRTVVSGGTVELSHSGAVSLYATIYDNYIGIWSGAKAHYTELNGGALFVMSGNSYYTSAYDGVENIGSAGVSLSSHIFDSGRQDVKSGGSSLSTTLHEGTNQWMSGYASATTIWSGAAQYVLGGITSATVVHNGGIQKVSSGGRSYGTHINSGGEQWVKLGGSATGTVITNAYQTVSSGGRTYHDVLNDGANQYLYGGIASGTKVYGGIQKVSSGGQASGTVISGGEQWVKNGGVATDTTISLLGVQMVYANAIARNTVLKELYASQRVESGGIVSNTVVSNTSIQNVLAGGIAHNTVISSGGFCFITSGASLYGFTQYAGGSLSVRGHASGGNTYGDMYLYGATASAVSVQSGGIMKVSSGSVATDTMMLAGGIMWISSGGTAISTIVSSGAGIHCYAGGTATNTRVQSQGQLHTHGGTIAGTTELYGYLQVQSNATHTGNIVMNLGSPSTTYQFITGFGKLSGGSYTVKATSSLATGLYALADSTGLNNITLTVNSSTQALSKGNSVTVGGYTYTLVNEQSKSMLRITAASGGASAGLNAIDDGFSEAMNMLSAGDSPGNLFAAQDEFLDISPGVGICGGDHALACTDSCDSDTSTALKQALLA